MVQPMTPEDMKARIMRKVDQSKTAHSPRQQSAIVTGKFYYVAGIAGGKHLFEGPRTQADAFVLKQQLAQQPENKPCQLEVFESPSRTGVRDEAVREYKDKRLSSTKVVNSSLHRMLRNLPEKYRRQ